MKESLRVLQVVTIMDRAGLETTLMNYYRHIDRERIQFDFLTQRQHPGEFDEEIRDLGGRIYCMPPIGPRSIFHNIRQTKQFFQAHTDYRIVHSHIDALSTFPLGAAKRAGIPVRIAHSHTTNFDKDIKYPMRLVSRRLLPRYATDYFACSEPAGRFMFRSKWNESATVVQNAIPLEPFCFLKESRRDEIRASLGLSDYLVMGHVGRFTYPKNHPFLIDIFNRIYQMEKKARLLLVGSGPMEQEIRQKVAALGLEKAVVFFGNRSDIADLMQAMDVLLLPSFFEGIPVVLIEAQAAGLPCVVSGAVSRQSSVTDLVSFIDLNQPIDKWAQTILEKVEIGHKNTTDSMVQAGYDIKHQAGVLQQLYLTLAERE